MVAQIFFFFLGCRNSNFNSFKYAHLIQKVRMLDLKKFIEYHVVQKMKFS